MVPQRFAGKSLEVARCVDWPGVLLDCPAAASAAVGRFRLARPWSGWRDRITCGKRLSEGFVKQPFIVRWRVNISTRLALFARGEQLAIEPLVRIATHCTSSGVMRTAPPSISDLSRCYRCRPWTAHALQVALRDRVAWHHLARHGPSFHDGAAPKPQAASFGHGKASGTGLNAIPAVTSTSHCAMASRRRAIFPKTKVPEAGLLRRVKTITSA